MYLASVSSCPFRPVLLTRSDPAKSTRWSLERRSVAEPGSRLHTCTVKIQWERVDAWFIGVWRWEKKEEETEHFVSPLKSVHIVDTKKEKKGIFTLHLLYFPYWNNKKHVSFDSYFSCSRWFEDQSLTMCNRWAVNTWWQIYKSWGWFSDGHWNSRSQVETRRRQK